MRGRLSLSLLGLALAGCVRQAVLENDVQNAVWRSRTLSTASDLSLAHAALSAQLVELEALYQRDPSDRRVTTLLAGQYRLMARGFVELRRLEAVAAGDEARAAQESQLKSDAEARSRYYGAKSGSPGAALKLEAQLAEPAEACRLRDRAAYERLLNERLTLVEKHPEERLQRALLRRLASLWLAPQVAARCRF